MTRTELCQIVLNTFGEKLGRNEFSEHDAYTSSTLAVAMETLGMLKDPDVKHYASTRGGIGWKEFVPDIPKKIRGAESLRNALALLPA